MCDISRRELIAGGAGMLGLILDSEIHPASAADVNKVDLVAPDVYFHEGDLAGKGHCNNGWVIFEDYVLVIDANFPSGAELILPKIKAITNKPIRFAFDTHHHGDHAYGNQVWVDNGATPIAHTGVVEEMHRYEPGRWNDTAKTRPDVAASRLKPPSVLFPHELIFDDGKHRVELIHFGVAHTHGDAFAWLPKEKILFGGDACVNGPYNFVGDGDVEKWVRTLEAAKKLGASVLCPGHGPRGTGQVVDDQQSFFKALREEVGKLVTAGKSPAEVKASVEMIRGNLKANAQIARYAGDSLPAQVEKVFTEMTGKAFARVPTEDARFARHFHARAHGLA